MSRFRDVYMEEEPSTELTCVLAAPEKEEESPYSLESFSELEAVIAFGSQEEIHQRLSSAGLLPLWQRCRRRYRDFKEAFLSTARLWLELQDEMPYGALSRAV